MSTIMLEPARRTRRTAADRVQAASDPATPDFIRFGRAICGDLDEAERREWWIANGRGGYAAGTVAGSLTRRYHGLLIAPVAPPLGRRLVFAKADATLVDGERSWPLFANRWAGGAVVPAGHVDIESFALDGTIPVWRFAAGPHRIEARIWMEQGANTTYAAWRLLPDPAVAGRPLTLRVGLLVNDRDHHGDTDRGRFDPQVEAAGTGLRVRADGVILTLQAPGGRIAPHRHWVENFDLPVERERGLGDRDFHLSVGEAAIELVPGRWVGIVASLEPDAPADLEAALARRRGHESGVLARALRQDLPLRGAPDWVRQLVLAADGFVFARPSPGNPNGKSIIAGYPWFGDWGRDTMIALAGLTLVTGRYRCARLILETFARFVDRGMLPNVFPGAGEQADYNTADASLWYVEAWRAYLELTGDRDSVGRVFPVLADMIAWHRRGTRYGIGMDPADGLLRAGEPGVQLTWMDAKVGDWVVTPRIGKPVEINALWYNALRVMADLAEMLGEPAAEVAALAERVRQSFQRYVTPAGGLLDVLDGPAGDDPTVRPNQILAVSLPHSPLPHAAQAAVVARCARDLLTSYGLRSLTPASPEFRGHYQGGVWERDGGYHQGPVWAWLLGHYALAEYRVHGDAEAAQRRLAPIRDHLLDAGLGQVSEIFDGTAPHRPRGCPAQAWSVACILEAWVRLEQAKRDGARPSPTE